MLCLAFLIFFFFFNDTATTEIYTLSLHDALPTSTPGGSNRDAPAPAAPNGWPGRRDRKSTRLNSSHGSISYAVFCLKKKKPFRATAADSVFSPATRFARPPTFGFPWWLFLCCIEVFFFNDAATTEIYTLSLHDALPI